jgi:hypothetical protein
MNQCIVIPIYKKTPSETELISLRQCLKILSKYQIIFVACKELDCSVYVKICKEYNAAFSFEYFPYYYSFGLYGYNALLLTKKFYLRFQKYQYMLIYQLDAYVFRDELEYWCDQDYDYIGAPFVSVNSIVEVPQFGNRYNVAVGNGGFCLRKIDTFIRLSSPEIRRMYLLCMCITLFNILVEKSKKNFFCKFIRLILFPLKIIIDKLYYATGESKNEDILWSKLLQSRGRIPSAGTAAAFSFESRCDYLYEFTDHRLPFGCHGWPEYYKWQLFWKKFIPLLQTP